MPKPKFWRFINQTAESAELLLYGDISETSWWGDEVTPKQFADDLAALGAVRNITVRINSGGGDVFAAHTIGNLLEANQAYVTAIIDGICASAATVVACKADKCIAAADTAYMVHPIRVGLMGYYNGDDLRGFQDAIATMRENIVSLYARKTGREKDEVAAGMDATSWWTAEQARDNGFIDEITGAENPIMENRDGVLFVNSINTHLPFEKAPKTVQDSAAAAPAASRSVNTPSGENAGNHQQEEDPSMEINTVDELRQAYPELVAQIEEAARDAATTAERERIREIRDMALPGAEDITDAAMFTEPISAADYAINAVKHAKGKGAAWLEGAQNDADGSGVNGVQNDAPGGEQKDEFLDAIRATKKNK